MSFQTSRPRMPVRTTSKAEVLPPGWQIAPDKRFTGCAFLLKSERKYPGIPLGESVAIQPVIEKQNHTVKNFGTVGYVLPRSEFLRGMADAVTTGDEDHGYRRNLGNLLGVLSRFAGQIHGGKAEGFRGVTDDGPQGGIRRSWLRIVY